MAMIYSNRGHAREHNEDAIFAAGNIVSGNGVWEALPVEDIERCLSSGEDRLNGADRLATGLLAQCRDNISFVII